jgi:hypothetical protein
LLGARGSSLFGFYVSPELSDPASELIILRILIGRMARRLRSGKDFEGSPLGQIEVLSVNLPGGSEGNH